MFLVTGLVSGQVHSRLATSEWESLEMDSLHGNLHVTQRTSPPRRIRLGNENIPTIYEACGRARLAVVANQTSVIGDGLGEAHVHLIDTLLALGMNVKKVFAPEHGFRGLAHNGAHIDDSVDLATGLPILSLHGEHKKPTPESLEDVRVILFDIQDVGARFYTYLSSLFLVMQAAAEQDKLVVVLDRPNPHGHQIAGPVLTPEWTSYVGQVPVPVLHGMTLGEIAGMINGEGWLGDGLQCDLLVVPCEGYAHSDAWYPQNAPSPNLPTPESIALYPSLCPFEPTVVSVGRGTPAPFECIGMPSPNFGSFMFTPVPIEGAAPHPKHEGVVCTGQNLHSLGHEWTTSNGGFDWSFLPAYCDQWKLHQPDEPFITAPDFLNKLAGHEALQHALNESSDFERYVSTWLADLRSFEAQRAPYLLYPVQRPVQRMKSE